MLDKAQEQERLLEAAQVELEKRQQVRSDRVVTITIRDRVGTSL